MRVLVASEAHFARAADGTVYAEGPEDYAFWAAYRAGFEQVGVVARLGCGGGRPQGRCRADGEGVVFYPLADYRGPWQYLGGLRRLRAQIRRAVDHGDAFILRVPGAVGYLAWKEIRRRGRPFAVEVLGDPWESLAPGRVSSAWRPVARRWSRRLLGRLCREAQAACYVTRSWLQQRYPSPAAAVFACSDVRLTALAGEAELSARFERIRRAAAGRRPWQVGFIGSLETLCKAPEDHLRAVEICRRRGLQVRLSLAGDGRYRPELERLARQLGLGESVRFLGAVPPGPPVEEFLDGIDLFVLVSHTEGLPRALVEAMARGCPAIGSHVGGIPELLEPEDLVRPGDSEQLAAKIMEVLREPGRLCSMAGRNHSKAHYFSPEQLQATRCEFFEEVRRRSGPGPGDRAG